MIERSRIPVSAICKVRGIGVADSVSHVHICLEFFQTLLVLDAKALFLIHDQQAEAFELDILGQQRMRANDDIDRSVRHAFLGRACILGGNKISIRDEH